jgi:hypothetical protein
MLEVLATVYVLHQQNGQVLYTGMVRHKEPWRCPIAADGLWQIFRYDIMGEEFPDFNGELELWWVIHCYGP